MRDKDNCVQQNWQWFFLILTKELKMLQLLCGDQLLQTIIEDYCASVIMTALYNYFLFFSPDIPDSFITSSSIFIILTPANQSVACVSIQTREDQILEDEIQTFSFQVNPADSSIIGITDSSGVLTIRDDDGKL